MKRDQLADLVPVLSPVQQLESLLRRAVTEQALTQLPTGKALATLVGLDPEPRRNWNRAYIELTNLIDDARRHAASGLDSFEGSPHARTFEAIEAVFSQVALDGGPWTNYVHQLNHLANIALPFVVHAVDGHGPPPVIQASLLTEVRQDLDALLEKILSSSLPADFKEEFARTVALLRDTLIRFHVYGARGVGRATALVVGSIATNENAVKSDTAVVRETAETISKLQDVFLKAFKIGKIGAAVWKVLGPGS